MDHNIIIGPYLSPKGIIRHKWTILTKKLFHHPTIVFNTALIVRKKKEKEKKDKNMRPKKDREKKNI